MLIIVCTLKLVCGNFSVTSTPRTIQIRIVSCKFDLQLKQMKQIKLDWVTFKISIVECSYYVWMASPSLAVLEIAYCGWQGTFYAFCTIEETAYPDKLLGTIEYW